jgi:hypothetical protein
MHMAPLTILFGIYFIALGLIGFVPSQAPTALIPAAFGVVFVLLGLLARKDRLRMHAMHLAALLGLLGFLGGGVMVGLALAHGVPRPLAFTMQILLALGAAVFLALCIKSFVDIRRRRRAAKEGERPA